MKNYKIAISFFLVLAVIPVAGIGPKQDNDDLTRPARGKIISSRDIEEEIDGVKIKYVKGEVCPEDRITKELIKDKPKKFKVRKKEIPCWFREGCNDTGDWVFFIDKPGTVHGDPVDIEIIGYLKQEYGRSFE